MKKALGQWTLTKRTRRRGLNGSQQAHTISLPFLVLLRWGVLNPEANPNGGQWCCFKHPNKSKSSIATVPARRLESHPTPRERHGVITLVKTYGFLASSQEPGQKSRVLQLVKPQRSEQKTSQKRVRKADDKRPPDHLEYKCVQVIE